MTPPPKMHLMTKRDRKRTVCQKIITKTIEATTTRNGVTCQICAWRMLKTPARV